MALSIVALIAIAIPLSAASFVEGSREAAAEGRVDEALNEAQDAVAIEPFASTPRMQKAAVLERLGQVSEAVEAARAATEEEPTNWRTWVVLSRLEALNGKPEASVEAFERARSLFPRLIGT